MKKIITLALLTVLGMGTSFAQLNKDEVQLVQAIWGKEKRAIITDFMKFTDAEATAFWPIYEEYQTEAKKLGEERLITISDYTNNVSKLTNEKADEIAMKILKNNLAVDKLQSKYYAKMKKAVTAIRAAQFMQLDVYLQTMLRAELQSSLPMIGELDKTAK